MKLTQEEYHNFGNTFAHLAVHITDRAIAFKKAKNAFLNYTGKQLPYDNEAQYVADRPKDQPPQPEITCSYNPETGKSNQDPFYSGQIR